MRKGDNHTYILRSISYERFDVLVAFRMVRKDTDGSLILLWKKLKRIPHPVPDPPASTAIRERAESIAHYLLAA